jgi:hypothetical protein
MLIERRRPVPHAMMTSDARTCSLLARERGGWRWRAPATASYLVIMRWAGALLGCSIVAAACGQTQPEPDAAPPDSSTQNDVGATDVTSSSDVADTGSVVEASIDAADADAESDTSADVWMDAGACGPYEANGPYGCNKLLPPSTNVAPTCTPLATATGGTIVDGYYELTKYSLDSSMFDAACPTNVTHAGIVMFCAGTMLWFDIDQNQSSFDSTGTYTTNGNTITISPASTCSGNKDTYEYTATPTTFEIRGGSTVTMMFTYTLK